MMRLRAARSRARSCIAALCVFGVLALVPPPLAGQGAAEPYAPAQHWSREALRRLAGAGLVDVSWVTAPWPLGRARIAALFAEAAAAAAEAGDAGAAELARASLARFREEFPEPERGGVSFSGALTAGWQGERGGLLAGSMEWEDGVGWVYPGPRALPAAGSGVVEGRLDVSVAGWLSASALPRWTESGVAAGEAYVAARAGGVEAWLGRRALALGPAPGGGVVLSDAAAFDGGAVAPSGEGLRLPGPLRVLGPMRPVLLLARMERSGDVRRPWFTGMRVGFAPSSSFSFGFNRAALFGGAGNEPVTARRILLMMIGLTDTDGKDSDFENQVASMDAALRVSPAGVPLLLHAEWGFDDMGFGWTNVPGVVAGIEAAALPGAPGVSVGLEHAWFAGHCCGNPPWYRHGALGEGWTDRGVPLGHPLGGHGRETALSLRVAAPARGAFVSGRAYVRHRGEENLFAPDRAGASVGAALRGVVWARRGVRLHADAELERGEGWTGWRASLAAELGPGR